MKSFNFLLIAEIFDQVGVTFVSHTSLKNKTTVGRS